jgi:hypothetical protein
MRVPDRCVADLRDRGYLIFEGFLEAGELAAAQDALWLHYPQPEEYFADPAVHSWLATDQWAGEIRGPWRSWSLNRLAFHPDLLDLAERFLGPADLRLYCHPLYCHPRSVRSINTSSRARGARRDRATAAFKSAPCAATVPRSAAPGNLQYSTPGPGNRSRAGRLLPLFGPAGHGGVGAVQAQGWPATPAEPRETARRPHAWCTLLPSSRRPSLEPGKISRKGALRASLVMPFGHPCPCSSPARIAPIRRTG